MGREHRSPLSPNWDCSTVKGSGRDHLVHFLQFRFRSSQIIRGHHNSIRTMGDANGTTESYERALDLEKMRTVMQGKVPVLDLRLDNVTVLGKRTAKAEATNAFSVLCQCGAACRETQAIPLLDKVSATFPHGKLTLVRLCFRNATGPPLYFPRNRAPEFPHRILDDWPSEIFSNLIS